ncbi:MAG TPA: hypothetical protein DCK79_00880 [Candidatus Atribacteria bacterium]|nr:MAG: hypothetical protein XD75_0351 [Parcubacteria bacterium 33_209]HAJ31920.1 hypothetical protein [Candidatus Atribacteria bacterium]
MAVDKVLTNSVLRLQLQTGVDGQGNPIYRSRNLSNTKPDAADQDLFDVANSLAGLQEYTLSSINRSDNAQLIEV